MPRSDDPVTVYLALGTNEGDRWANLREAVRQVAECVSVEALSNVYETEPAYVADQPRYLNMALKARTALDPYALLQCLKRIERRMGRRQAPRWGRRPIDLDILIYGELELVEPDLQIPHARLAERPFVLEPLRDVAPSLVVPGIEATVAELAGRAPPIGDIIARLGRLPEE